MTKRVLRILSIDDDKGCQLTVARYFTLVGGHMVEVAGSGREGIDKASELRPDMILLDLGLPDMHGLTVFESLSVSPDTRDIPVIILTGAELDEATVKSLKLEGRVVSIEQKPAKLSDLLAKIECRLCLRTAVEPADISPLWADQDTPLGEPT